MSMDIKSAGSFLADNYSISIVINSLAIFISQMYTEIII